MQLTDEQDKRCYPLEDHLFCHMCHIKRLHQEYPGEQFYIDPYTFHILNKTPGGQRDSIAVMPATMSSYPNLPIQTSGSHSNGIRGAPPSLPSVSSNSSDEPPPLPPHRKITVNGVNGFDSPNSPYMNKPMPQVPTGNPNGMKYTITDLWCLALDFPNWNRSNDVKRYDRVALSDKEQV